MQKNWSRSLLGVCMLGMLIPFLLLTTSIYAAAPSAHTQAIQAGVFHLSTVPNSSLSSSIPKVHAIPLDTPTCFNVSMNVATTGTNTIAVHGIASFFCGLTDNGGLSVTTSILCPGGIAPGPATSRVTFPSGIRQNPQWSYLTNFTGYCEHCVNHIPTIFPFFTLTTSVYAYSYTASPGLPVNDPASYSDLVEGTGGPVSTGLVNSSSYRIPC